MAQRFKGKKLSGKLTAVPRTGTTSLRPYSMCQRRNQVSQVQRVGETTSLDEGVAGSHRRKAREMEGSVAAIFGKDTQPKTFYLPESNCTSKPTPKSKCCGSANRGIMFEGASME